MARKEKVVVNSAKTLKEAQDVYVNRHGASLADLIGAKDAFKVAKTVMKEREDSLKREIETKTPEQITLELDSYRSSSDEDVVFVTSSSKTRVKVDKIVDSDIDAAAILALAGSLPGKYFVQTLTINKKQILEDALAGTLDSRIAGYVSVTVVEQPSLFSSAFKGSTASATASAPATSSASQASSEASESDGKEVN